MDRIMAVVSGQKQYAQRLSDYVNRSDRLSLYAVPFESMESCFEYSRKHKIELLMADSCFFSSAYGCSSVNTEEIKASCRAVLTEETVKGPGTAESGITAFSGETVVLNKFQSAESLVSELAEKSQVDGILKKQPAGGRSLRVIGVYSPVMRCGKTSFALTMCRDLGKRNKVLYVNLEEFPPILRLLRAGRRDGTGISEAVYKLKQGKLDETFVKKLIINTEGIEWIAPVSDPEDNNVISGDDYAELIAEIMRLTEYDYMILDMNRFSGQADRLIELCKIVYMPFGKDIISQIKKESFTEYIEEEKNEKWRQRLKWIELPEPDIRESGVSYLDSLLYGAMGDLVRDINRQ